MMFTQEHIDAREKYGTTQQVEALLNVIDTTCLNEKISRFFQEDVIGFIERMPYFFLSTSNAQGHTNVNFKGSDGGALIRVLSPNKLLFPDYHGNGLFHAVGDINSNPHVGMLIIDFDKEIRLKISGTATVIDDQSVIAEHLDYFETFDIPRLIAVDIYYVIANCSKNIGVVKRSLQPQSDSDA